MAELRILGYIPARLGSVRVKAKNLRILGDRPLIEHAIGIVRSVPNVERFVVNTEADEIAAVAEACGMPVYRRAAELASSRASTDDIVIDFIRANPCDAVVVVNPTVPFLRTETIASAVAVFAETGATSLFSVSQLRKHAFLHGEAMNFSVAARSPRTQDLDAISYLNFAICIFDAKHARQRFEQLGYFLYTGKLHFFEISQLEAVDIDSELDFQIAESILGDRHGPAYHPSIGDAGKVLPT